MDEQHTPETAINFYFILFVLTVYIFHGFMYWNYYYLMYEFMLLALFGFDLFRFNTYHFSFIFFMILNLCVCFCWLVPQEFIFGQVYRRLSPKSVVPVDFLSYLWPDKPKRKRRAVPKTLQGIWSGYSARPKR